ncbi:hypothetical protein [Micromonospora sp. AMSO31t]|uniref:hypothetical protein n=1 Tax=Micromonospora sp. AMSO31t TaxID=2650566 RepID=UPI001CECFFC8|nr:hypothetical protein [Micromonospora sp. AMSO31t]
MRTRWLLCPTRKLPEREPARSVGAGPGVAGGRAPLAAGVLTATAHVGHRPAWDCGRCGEPWPCPAFRAIRVDSAALLPVMSSLLGGAIRDLRGRPEGPEPPEIVRRFLWFLPLTGEEARAVARRLR